MKQKTFQLFMMLATVGVSALALVQNQNPTPLRWVVLRCTF
jgi:hypothetical protein